MVTDGMTFSKHRDRRTEGVLEKGCKSRQLVGKKEFCGRTKLPLNKRKKGETVDIDTDGNDENKDSQAGEEGEDLRSGTEDSGGGNEKTP